MNSLITQLQWYLRLGFSPIPLKGKIPLVKWKEFTLTDDNQGYWVNKKCNWGIKAGLLLSGDHLWFVDLDTKEMLGTFYEAHPSLMCAPLVSTNRGWHLWVTSKEPVRTHTFPGGEIRGVGSYVVVPPSVHPSGHVYKFVVPLKGLPPTYNPAWLGAQIASPTVVLDPSNEANFGFSGSSIPASVPQGRRHNTLISYLGAMHGAHFTEEEALARAIAWNLKNSPPLPQDELIATVKTCYEKWDVFEG